MHSNSLAPIRISFTPRSLRNCGQMWPLGAAGIPIREVCEVFIASSFLIGAVCGPTPPCAALQTLDHLHHITNLFRFTSAIAELQATVQIKAS